MMRFIGASKTNRVAMSAIAGSEEVSNMLKHLYMSNVKRIERSIGGR